MSFCELINAIKMRLSKQRTLSAEVSFDSSGKKLYFFGVSFGSLVTSRPSEAVGPVRPRP